jgi:enoyl-[acyl-carrier protein] reductase II
MAERGVDVIVAQGAEAGGFAGDVATLVLVAQVVGAVEPIPVLAAGGISEGRQLAAALALGAQGAKVGTRFLAAEEATVPDEWKQAILAARADDAVKLDFWWAMRPPPRASSMLSRAPSEPRLSSNGSAGETPCTKKARR